MTIAKNITKHALMAAAIAGAMTASPLASQANAAGGATADKLGCGGKNGCGGKAGCGGKDDQHEKAKGDKDEAQDRAKDEKADRNEGQNKDKDKKQDKSACPGKAGCGGPDHQ